MAENFDPYYKWFGIPPQEQPPTHYRLLGVTPGESDPEVLSAAADRQMAFLKTVRGGQHMDVAERLLNEVADARRTLLNTERRQEYDRKLASLAAPKPAPSAPAMRPVKPRPIAQPQSDEFGLPTPSPISVTAESDATSQLLAAQRKRNQIIATVAGSVVVAIVLLVLLQMFTSSDSSEPMADASSPPAAINPAVTPPPGDPPSNPAQPTRPTFNPPPAVHPPTEPSEPPAMRPVSVIGSEPETVVIGEPISLLPLIDTQRDTIGLPAQVTPAGLVKPEKSAVVLPVVVADRYELLVKVTPQANNPVLVLSLPVGDNAISFWAGGLSGLSCVDGHHMRHDGNPTRLMGTEFMPGRAYDLRIQVAIEGDDAVIESTLNGSPFVNHRMPSARLGRWNSMEQKAFRQPAIQAESTGLCHSVSYRALASDSRLLATDEPWNPVPWSVVGQIGDDQGPFFHEQASGQHKLLGFSASAEPSITGLQPIFGSGETHQPGRAHIANGVSLVSSIAKPGYAVGGMVARFDGRLTAFQLIFMRDEGDRLNPGDSYRGEWIGSEGGIVQRPIVSLGRPITGYVACARPDAVICLGLTSTSDEWLSSPMQPNLPKGQWINLQPKIKLDPDAVMGRWSWQGDNLQLDPSFMSRVAVPIVFKDASYDIRLDFVRLTGNDCVNVYLPIAEHSALLEVDTLPQTGYSTFVSMADRLRASDHPKALHGQILQNGPNLYEISVQTENDIAQVTFRLNGQAMFVHRSGTQNFEPVYPWRLWNGRQLGIAAFGTKIDIREFSLRLNSGSARQLPNVPSL